jgi:hypothetical protein
MQYRQHALQRYKRRLGNAAVADSARLVVTPCARAIAIARLWMRHGADLAKAIRAHRHTPHTADKSAPSNPAQEPERRPLAAAWQRDQQVGTVGVLGDPSALKAAVAHVLLDDRCLRVVVSAAVDVRCITLRAASRARRRPVRA